MKETSPHHTCSYNSNTTNVKLAPGCCLNSLFLHAFQNLCTRRTSSAAAWWSSRQRHHHHNWCLKEAWSRRTLITVCCFRKMWSHFQTRCCCWCRHKWMPTYRGRRITSACLQGVTGGWGWWSVSAPAPLPLSCRHHHHRQLPSMPSASKNRSWCMWGARLPVILTSIGRTRTWR